VERFSLEHKQGSLGELYLFKFGQQEPFNHPSIGCVTNLESFLACYLYYLYGSAIQSYYLSIIINPTPCVGEILYSFIDKFDYTFSAKHGYKTIIYSNVRQNLKNALRNQF
jgi:hypothetical protein